MKYVYFLLFYTSLTLFSNEILHLQSFKIENYMGTWYEIASLPQFFQRGCECTLAQYQLKSSTEILINNSCLKDNQKSGVTLFGFIQTDATSWEIKFKWWLPFSTEYKIVGLNNEQTVAVVSNRAKSSLWIFSRSAEIPQELYSQIEQYLSRQQYPIKELQKTKQSNCNYSFVDSK